MTGNEGLMSVRALKLLLSRYGDDYQIDFGINYLVSLKDEGSNILSCEWINKAKQDAITETRKQEEAYKHAAETSLPLEQSGLDKRTVRLLATNGIHTIYQLAYNTQEEIMRIKGLGMKAISQMEIELPKHGWWFGGCLMEKSEKTAKKNNGAFRKKITPTP
ncbi:hypothetical protein CJD36_009135 [Flavipsychrobacter stenotrophus]|uniref:RNA polymerase alpha subunit C-terminal domain-containing protein n=1 Tax=Flavipsychrobacter stenotrophus TaxID=2077091 RepID=A0A2S7SZE7_9BACT|nr:DNA-directed RNA polymerase subunit alpha C-terminal domain-containing protein [Flavipsychrobacter stenotrophus]PQJ11945.1 hypothetical protein CJD36_009135 [Flavipsychrobacter stenotrophus]